MTEWINLCYFPFRFVICLFCISFTFPHSFWISCLPNLWFYFVFFCLSTRSHLTLSLHFIILYFIFFHPHRIHTILWHLQLNKLLFFVYSGRTWNKTLWIIAKIKMLCVIHNTQASSMSNNSISQQFSLFMPKWWCVLLLS